ncbi:GNAT family N-acetyltransferase [Paludisphaera rhizosphaerae]|uniref:GNAT family N-acetyltransferase n=1 Tax=Paludisphaera rhizosphaerae TaxID=2711216 RepID=UPI0013EC767B|nr:GNAT family N-acetyltransferase [Paludisphaera rhizosphaerae]
MIHYRPFRNADPPALVKLWNAAVPESSSARPLSVHELDDHAFNPPTFDRQGLIVAERDGRPVGFVHAGFGPVESEPPQPLRLDHEMGVVAMLVVEPGAGAEETAGGLVVEAERYLRRKGAKVLYGGGALPMNPFYWGLYGGSEAAGVPSSHFLFNSTLTNLGYEPISTAVHLHFDLHRPDPRDPRAGILRRQFETVFEEDPVGSSWWEILALADFHPMRVGLRSRADGVEVARAYTWDMTWFGRNDGRPRLGVFGVEVEPAHRRKGYGRFLFGEIIRQARERGFLTMEVQALADNEPAMILYQTVDFEPVEQSTVFRLPAPFPERSRP